VVKRALGAEQVDVPVVILAEIDLGGTWADRDLVMETLVVHTAKAPQRVAAGLQLGRFEGGEFGRCAGGDLGRVIAEAEILGRVLHDVAGGLAG